jgi:4-amino-4-deoxy-L-arabinose transferase-like glycosyltransferase
VPLPPDMSISSPGSLRSHASRLLDALADRRRSHRLAAALIAVYALLWWGYAVIAKSTQDIHFDMGEVFSWSTELAYGYPKHPPFPAWVAAAWFAVFPRADWAYYLLSVTNVAVALWFTWLISARYLQGDKRAVALLLLTLAPTFNFLPLKFNSNALLMPVWAGATWLFLRSHAERTWAMGALAGAGAAIAMLTKYWSIFLIIGFAVGALADSRRRDYFRSGAPWASILAGAILFAPNIVSLVGYDFQPFKYAAVSHEDQSLVPVLASFVNYLSGFLYLAGAFAAVQIAAAPAFATWREMLWPSQQERALMAVILWSSFLSPIVVALLLNMRLNSLWTMPCWAMLPALLLSAPGIAINRRAATIVLALPYLIACVALLIAPLAAVFNLQRGIDNLAAYYSLVAGEVDRQWALTSREPLRYAAGPEGLAWGCTFYCRDRPRAFPSFDSTYAPWIDPAAMARAGFVGLCLESDQACLNQARAIAGANPNLREDTVELARSFFGLTGEPQRFTIVLAPPQR